MDGNERFYTGNIEMFCTFNFLEPALMPCSVQYCNNNNNMLSITKIESE